MVTYFPGPEIVITDRAVVVYGPRPATFRLNKIRNPRVVRGDVTLATVLTSRFAVGALVVAVATAPLIGNPARVATLSAAVLLCIVSLAMRYLAPRYYELRVTYNGFEVRLYESADQTRFNQVKRAFGRALEAEQRRSRTMSDQRTWPVHAGTYQQVDSTESSMGVWAP
jgi:hypothetical protein